MNMNEQSSRSGPPGPMDLTPDPGSTESETSSNSPETPPARMSDAEQAKAVAELLNGETPPAQTGEDPGDPDLEDPAPEAKDAAPAPKTITDAAERLGIEPADLYGLEISTGDGETITLGKLKDAHQDRQTASRETAERQAALDARETGLIADQQLWAQLGETLTKALPPEQLQRLQSSQQAKHEHEHQMMVQTMPELQDTAKMDQFRLDVVDALKNYGYQPHEITVGDHRQLLVIRDLIRAKKRLKELSEFKPAQKAPKAQPGKGRGTMPSRRDALVGRAQRSGSEGDKVAAVAALLNGK